MKIAHLLPTSAKLPLVKHNGRYEWVFRLAKLQSEAGHDVTIFAGGNSGEQGITWRTVDTNDENKRQKNLALLNLAFEDDSFDICHSHFDNLHYFAADKTEKPVIATQHWFPHQEIADAVSANTRHNVVAVPLTQFMQREDTKLGIPKSAYIHHGIDLSLFSYNDTRNDRLLFVGRIHPNKGVGKAVQYALQTNSNLDIIGKINATEQEYWSEIEPYVDGERIRYLGPKHLEEVAAAYKTAKAVIFPSTHAEAFGQVTIEAQACGTPVIISDVGASSELVQHGVTGFVCHSDEDFIAAIHAVDTLDRRACRSYAEQFDIHAMVRAYTSLYEQSIRSIDSVLAE